MTLRMAEEREACKSAAAVNCSLEEIKCRIMQTFTFSSHRHLNQIKRPGHLTTFIPAIDLTLTRSSFVSIRN